MSYCKVKKANIYYEEYGTGTPIVMIHGFSPDHRLMKGCMEPIFQEREGYRRIYLDLPGMGQTKDYEEIQNTEEMLESVLEFIEAMIPDQSFLIAGESYGGYLTRGVVAKIPEKVLGATFICPMIIPNKTERTLPEHEVVHRDEEFLATLSEVNQQYFNESLVVLNENTWNRFLDEVVVGLKIADGEFLEKIQKNYGYSFTLDEGTFTKPSLFLVGRQDNITGYKDAFDILDKYPRATFALLDGAGHNLQIEHPELLKAHVDEWLNEIDSYSKQALKMNI